MNILHYILGVPPHRTGGLTKYAMDLMQTEKELGHYVTLFYPGNIRFNSTVSDMHKCESYHGINVYKLTNGLPVPLMYGIKNPKQFTAHREIIGFDEFMTNVKPDVLHVHTLMGLPIELLRLFSVANVRIVLTSHDYFGLCPRVNFVNDEGKVCNHADSTLCQKCNNSAWPTWMLKLRNSERLVPLKELMR